VSELEVKGEIIGDRATGYPHLALCVLDAVWTPGLPAVTVRNVVSRYCAFAELPNPFAGSGLIAESPSPEPLRRFVEAIERDGAEGFARDALQNRQRTLGANSILKAEAAYRVASLLRTHGASYPADVVALHGRSDFEEAFQSIPGLGSAALTRLYALCGITDVAPAPISGAVAKKKRPETKIVETSAGVLSNETQRKNLTEIPPQRDIAPVEPTSQFLAEIALSEPPSPAVPHHAPKEVQEIAPSSVPFAPVDAVPVLPPFPLTSLPAPVGESTPESGDSELEVVEARYNVRIVEMPLDERPRERLAQYGAEALGHAELIAILLRTGTEKYNAVQVAERLLADFDGLRGVAQLTIDELSKVHGIGLAKAAQIKSAIELGRRLVAESPDSRYRIRSPQDVYNLLGPRLRDEKREHLIALLLDTKGGVIRQETISIGDLSSSIVNPREVYRPAVRHAANSLIVAHNHPSGDPTPSPEDVSVTRLLLEAGKLLSIELLDHVILGDNRFQSLKEKNLI
jgi:DNA repair protein RadC